MAQRCYMAGQAGANPKARWEGEVLAGPYQVPRRGKCYTVNWDKWTAGKEEGWTDIRSKREIVFI
jgi:hypothetical protein